MAEIHPFRGVRYAREVVSDLAAVLCPPYDIITSQMQGELYHRSQYNFVRLEDGWELPQDEVSNNRYTRAAATLEQWLEQGVLKIDKAPALYLHDHYFTYRGEEYRRRGIITCVRLEEWDKRVTRPHEGTLAEPRNDRLSLMWALQADTSPILALFEDPSRQVALVLGAQECGDPVISLGSVDGERHNVWAITDPAAINQLAGYLVHQPLYVADGHHRYESALTYQRERQSCSSSLLRDEAFNFVLMELVELAEPGLVILPPHRLVRGVSKVVLGGLMDGLRALFEIEELPLDMPDVWQRVDSLLADETTGVRLILFGLTEGRLLVLRLRDLDAACQMMPYFHSELYKKLDVSVVDHVILEKLLGLGGGGKEGVLAYTYEGRDAVGKVLSQEYQLAFLLSPARAKVIKAIADAGDRMPRKSTYFYPKAPAGLVFYRLV
ncbi:MAG TPA: DUF1015 domain-containing protein [Dehalococcoidia bacterium]|nr:DUF1015 domain-containing protein [Dehalococcoidia bacterium]